jgi:predicted  nucleic acid-binding Zn-ribbon protein
MAFPDETGCAAGVELHPDLKAVMELQQVDLKIAELSAQIDDLPGQIQNLESQLNEFIHAHEDQKSRLTQNQKERRDLDGEIQIVQARITKHKDQLYQVKTNEQYRAMLKEIEGEESNIHRIEDQILEKMLEAEQLEKSIQDAAARLGSEKARVAQEVADLRALRQKDVDDRESLQARRQELEAAVSESVRNIYERVRKMRRGVALAEVRDGSCTGCNVLLRPQVYNEVRTNDSVLTCETCNRILYYLEPSPAAEEESENVSKSAGRELGSE